MASWFRKLFGRAWQPEHPPRPNVTPEEQAEPQARRTAADEPKTTPLEQPPDESPG